MAGDGRVQAAATAGRNVDASDQFLGNTPMGYFSTDRDSATLQGDLTPAQDQLLTLGLDWLRDHVDSDTPLRRNHARQPRRLRAIPGQVRCATTCRPRCAATTTTSSAATPPAAPHGASASRDAGAFTAGYGTAFKAPTFNELYYPFFGNPDLRPESSRTWEAGIAYRVQRFHWRLDGFSTAVDDLIAYDALDLPAQQHRPCPPARRRTRHRQRHRRLEPRCQCQLAGSTQPLRCLRGQPAATPFAPGCTHRPRPCLRQLPLRRHRHRRRRAFRRPRQHQPTRRLRHVRSAWRVCVHPGLDPAGTRREHVRSRLPDRRVLQPAGARVAADRAVRARELNSGVRKARQQRRAFSCTSTIKCWCWPAATDSATGQAPPPRLSARISR